MDYQAELEKMRNVSDDNGYWSPDAGQHKVKALSEIEVAEPFQDDNENRPRRKLRLEVNNQEFSWTFPLGKRESSVYGQLLSLGSKRGKILGEEFVIVVVGKGQDKRYTIIA